MKVLFSTASLALYPLESAMAKIMVDFDEEDVEPIAPPEEALQAKATLRARCKEAGLELKEETREDGNLYLKVGMRCAREQRWLVLGSDESILRMLSVPFENYVFISGHEAICSYNEGTIEATIRPLGNTPSSFVFRRMFSLEGANATGAMGTVKLEINSPQAGLPKIEISPASDNFAKLVRSISRNRITLKLLGCTISTHDQAAQLLRKVADASFFQIDLLADAPLSLEKERKRLPSGGRTKKAVNLAAEIQYPKTEFDEAPISLYWYGRSASGMPLLQFLAFYQVLEFYYPAYSEAEARRKLKSILKDPVFRGDRDADIGRLLTAIHVNRSGAYGDERSQLRATIMECIEADALRAFLSADPERLEFYSVKSKTNPYHKIPISTATADLRGDVAERIYNIRCKIVHTKTDGRDSDVELLLPFSKEAEQLIFDIELAQYLAQQVLIAASSQYSPQG